jgi:hypothetical protein
MWVVSRTHELIRASLHVTLHAYIHESTPTELAHATTKSKHRKEASKLSGKRSETGAVSFELPAPPIVLQTAKQEKFKTPLGIPSIQVMHLVRHPKHITNPTRTRSSRDTAYYASTDTPFDLEALALRFLTAPGLLSVYLAKARASAFLHETFWLPTKLSTATAMARSMSDALQYSESRILAKASEIRRMDSR